MWTLLRFCLVLIQFVYCSNDLFGTRRTYARSYTLYRLYGTVWGSVHLELLTYSLRFFLLWKLLTPMLCHSTMTQNRQKFDGNSTAMPLGSPRILRVGGVASLFGVDSGLVLPRRVQYR